MNRTLFTSSSRAARAVAAVPLADMRNAAGGLAYRSSPEHALAQYAVTGCLSDTFYVTAEDQLDSVLKLAADPAVSAQFVAQASLYSRLQNMKDMPVLLLACLAVCGESDLFMRVAPTVCDNMKQVANLVKILRSGKVQGAFDGSSAEKGSTSLPQVARKFVRSWLTARDPDKLLNDSTGIEPKLGDLLKIAHPKPKAAEQAAAFAYFLGKTLTAEQTAVLPRSIRAFEAFKSAKGAERAALIGWINFRRLDSLGLTDEEWAKIALAASWQTARMNLNTFARHNVFERKGLGAKIAAKLSDKAEIAKAHAMPYQLFAAFKATEENANVPMECRLALQQAYETAVSLVPALPGRTAIAVDCSGSMQSPVTGRQGKVQASKITCNQAAALIAATIIRGTPNSRVMVFDDVARKVALNPLDSVMINATKLAQNGGSTNCAAPVQMLLADKEQVDTVVIVSDYESWADSVNYGTYSGWSTRGRPGLGKVWAEYRAKYPKAKLICIDLSPHDSTQVKSDPDHKDGVYHVGGFADALFPLIQRFARGETRATWIDTIKAIKLPEPGAKMSRASLIADDTSADADLDSEA